MKGDKVIQDWLEKELTSDEKHQMEKIISFTEKLEAPIKTSENDAWESLMAHIEESSSDNTRVIHPKTTRRNFFIWMTSAAVLFLVAYFSFFQETKLTTYQSPSGETLSFKLPDNSTVTLNASSTVSFKEKNWESNRTIVLRGEAFFEVTSGKTFTVLGKNGEVKVLGTSFNVYDRSNEFTVSVFTGRVAVTSGDNDVNLSVGEEVNLRMGKLEVSEFNPAQTATWRKGSFYFDAEPLSKVIKELERQFDIEITMKTDISERFYSGYFSKSNLTEALQLVFVPMGLSIESQGKQVTIE